MALTTVILAAGQGKRMNSDLPKVLQPLAGRSMLSHVLETAAALAPDAINVVYGHGGEVVREAFSESAVDWTLQAEQLGTGHALGQALPEIPEDHQILVLFGDVPLVTVASLRALLGEAPSSGIALLTAVLETPQGYGRVLRDAAGAVTAIVEDKDATPAQRAVNEINTGLMVVPAGGVRRWVEALRDENKQGEFYLTDVIAMAVGEGVPVVGVPVVHPDEVSGINDRAQLAAAERILQRRYARDVMAQGATLADPERFDLRCTHVSVLSVCHGMGAWRPACDDQGSSDRRTYRAKARMSRDASHISISSTGPRSPSIERDLGTAPIAC